MKIMVLRKKEKDALYKRIIKIVSKNICIFLLWQKPKCILSYENIEW
jgi:hypothetical protein